MLCHTICQWGDDSSHSANPIAVLGILHSYFSIPYGIKPYFLPKKPNKIREKLAISLPLFNIGFIGLKKKQNVVILQVEKSKKRGFNGKGRPNLL
jgi:hypothetical protein